MASENSDHVTMAKFVELANSFGCALSIEQVKKLNGGHPESIDSMLTFEVKETTTERLQFSNYCFRQQFCHLITMQLNNNSDQEISDVIAFLDKNNDSKVDINDLKSVFDEAGEKSLTTEELALMIEQADTTGNGTIDFAKIHSSLYN